jgi:hypothetical protein
VSGDGDFEADDVGFTVYRGHPYCEACHVRLRLPKCKRCKRSIRDGDQAVEALGGKWCWGCFVCAVSVCPLCYRFVTDPLLFDRVVRNRLKTRHSSRERTSRIASRALASSCGMSCNLGRISVMVK